MAALLEAYEPKDCCFNGLAHGEEAVILKKGRFLIA